ncbi:unnamed protein product, partial [Didymodactylos carnosus]
MFLRKTTSDTGLHIQDIDAKDKYNFVKEIGKGSYGAVWLVQPLRSKQINKQFVLKRLDLKQQNNALQTELEGAEREAELLSS